MIKRAIRFIRGSVTADITSAYTERFLNMCRANEIELWSVRRMAEDRVRVTLYKSDYGRVEPCAEKCMCSIERVRGSGLTEALRPLAGRYALLAAAALCVLACFFSTRFLWRIELYGCETVSRRELLSRMSELGLERGRFISGIDTSAIRLSIMTERSDIAFMTINIKGTRARVDITERRPLAIDASTGEPRDIVSDKSGVIKSMQVLCGTPAVAVGDTVIPGDILVYGAGGGEGGEDVCAAASITLRTWRDIAVSMSSEIYGLREMGREKTCYSLELSGRRIDWYIIEKPPFSWYYKTREILPGGDGGILPLRLIKETYRECTPALLELSEEKCSEILRLACESALNDAMGGGRVLSSEYGFVFGPDGICGRLRAECVENAGVGRPLHTNTGEQ